MMKIGVIPDAFQVPFKEAVILARDLGAKGLQPYVTRGELAPENLTKDDRKAILKYVRDNGLVFSALCADFGLHFNEKGTNEEGIERTMRMMDLALDFDTHVITTHIGKVPEDENCEAYRNMVTTIERLGKYGDAIGVAFATETGPEKALPLKAILEKADTKSAKVNLDPANFVMCSAQNPAEAVYLLKDYIVHTHAKDGRHLFDRDPEVVYGIKPGDPLVTDRSFIEVALGDGQVPFPAYLKALDEIGYHGFLTIEREVGDNPAADIEKAVNFLKERI
jgi:sugar phosphate isomerase/epimerase